jgi:hypothetical protein
MFFDDFDMLIKKYKKHHFNTFSIEKHFYKNNMHRITKHILKNN